MHPGSFLVLTWKTHKCRIPSVVRRASVRSRSLCVNRGILGGLAARVGWAWGASGEPSVWSCNRNLMCLGWNRETGFAWLFGTGLHVRAICLELADAAVSYPWLWSAGTAVQVSALFSFPGQNSGLTGNNTCSPAFFGTPRFRFSVDLGHLRSPSPSGCRSWKESTGPGSPGPARRVPVPRSAQCGRGRAQLFRDCAASTLSHLSKHVTYWAVLKGVCGDLWFPQLPSYLGAVTEDGSMWDLSEFATMRSFWNNLLYFP